MEFFLVHIQIFNKFITLSVTLTEIPILFFSKLHSEVLHTSFLFSSCRLLRNPQILKTGVFSNHPCYYFCRLYRDGLGHEKG